MTIHFQPHRYRPRVHYHRPKEVPAGSARAVCPGGNQNTWNDYSMTGTTLIQAIPMWTAIARSKPIQLLPNSCYCGHKGTLQCNITVAQSEKNPKVSKLSQEYQLHSNMYLKFTRINPRVYWVEQQCVFFCTWIQIFFSKRHIVLFFQKVLVLLEIVSCFKYLYVTIDPS